MGSLFKRVSKRMHMTWTKLVSDCGFSPYLAWLRLVDELGGRIGFATAAKRAHDQKDQWIQAYLKRRLRSVLETYAADTDRGIGQQNAPIWVCWWTGEDTAPALVKQCLRSIRAHAGTHPVCLIDRETYRQYVTIPAYMLQKVKTGQMGPAHLADYIRVSLLAERGGLWLDATMFCAADIPEEYFEMPVFTCKSETQDCGYLSKMRWVTFVLGGYAGNMFYRYLKAAFEEYWSKEKAAIDYLFFDHIIELGWNEIPAVKVALESVPLNNVHRDDLQAAMNAALSADQFDDVLCEDTVLYKLSWRETYSPVTAEGEKSVYAAFLEKEI